MPHGDRAFENVTMCQTVENYCLTTVDVAAVEAIIMNNEY